MNLKITLICLITCLSFFELIAQVHYQQMPPTHVEKDKTVSINGKYYMLNSRGLKKFLKETPIDSSLQVELNKKIVDLQSKEIIGSIFSWGGLITGGIIMFSGVSKYQDYPTETDSDLQYRKEKITSSIVIGLGVAAAGGLISWLIKPKEDDYLDVVNSYNSNSSKRKIKVISSINNYNNPNIGIAIKL